MRLVATLVGTLALVADAVAQCPRPDRLDGGPCCNVRFTGFVDYARSCADNLYEHAWMLTHQCDQIDHAPGFPRAGVFHPDRPYTFVGPAAGFIVDPIQPIEAGRDRRS